jgi:hypothetical protein
MKRLCLLISFLIVCGLAKAQTEQEPNVPPQREQNIEALKVAFLSKDLELTPDEAQRFWPVYNQYSAELKVAIKDNNNVLDRDERVLNIKKHYNTQFIQILGTERTNRMFGAEKRFRQLLIKAMRRQQDRPNRPLRRD